MEESGKGCRELADPMGDLFIYFTFCSLVTIHTARRHIVFKLSPLVVRDNPHNDIYKDYANRHSCE